MSVALARRVALEVLLKVARDEAYSHIALDAAFARRPDVSARDRGLTTRIVYGTLAWQRRLDAELDAVLKKAPEEAVRVVLRSALFQLRHLDRVPSHAVVNDAVNLAKKHGGRRVGGFVNAVLRRLIRDPKTPSEGAPAGIRYSLPDALIERIAGRLPEDEREAWAAAQNEVAPLTLRVNRSRVALAELPAPDAWSASTRTPGALHVEEGDALEALLADHRCAVQDEGSQRVGMLLEPLPEAGLIWDACAGQGGKSLYLADVIAARGLSTGIVATDLHPAKLERLEEAATAAFPEVSLEVRALDVASLVDTPVERRYEVALVDAPCSGLGLVRRHPEVRWRFDPKAIDALAALQARLLDAVAPRVKAGGVLVYAVCTNTESEGPAQIRSFLERHPDFSIEPPEGEPGWSGLLTEEGCVELWPHRHGCDGFFAARLRRSTT